ncbi:MAG: uracil-DNA glycosylase [Spirochaetaceae bacterium]|nr:MAG: uracil-DNA glycosylase [Spirochaetaceae bacterium]
MDTVHDHLYTLIEDYIASGYRRRNPRQRDAAATPQPAPAADDDRVVTGEERERRLADLVAAIRSCNNCPLSAVRNRAVPGAGVLDPLVMVIGEGPGADEDRTGEPFVGRAGSFLDKWLEAIDLSRETNAYITNIVKCRPPQNRDPLPDERAACIPYLERQIALVRPRVILSVGRISSRVVCGVDASMGEIRKQTFQYRGVPVVATYHPSAVLRNETLKRPVWEDLKRLRAICDRS